MNSEVSTDMLPAPWALEAQQFGSADMLYLISANDGKDFIAEIVSTGDLGHDYAEYIVQCVNAHDGLVAALNGMVNELENDMVGFDPNDWPGSLRLLITAHAALEKAK